MRRAFTCFALLAVACRFDASGSATAPDDPGAVDAGGEDGAAGDLLLPGPARYLYDTSSGALTREGGGAIEVDSEVREGVRIVEAASVVLAAGAELRVVGALPLAIVAESTIEIAGTLDASSSAAAGEGAGANPDDCSGERLRGGCRGAGQGGGSGGGAVALEARAQLAVGGRILVGGAGGAGGALSAGGGAGGDGGSIWLTAHAIALAEGAVLSANGGGGGEGGDGDDAGRSGEAAPADGRRAHGGAGAANEGGDGGEGAGDMDASGKPGKDGAGAAGAVGGAGGAGGVIRLSGLISDDGARLTPLY